MVARVLFVLEEALDHLGARIVAPGALDERRDKKSDDRRRISIRQREQIGIGFEALGVCFVVDPFEILRSLEDKLERPAPYPFIRAFQIVDGRPGA